MDEQETGPNRPTRRTAAARRLGNLTCVRMHFGETQHDPPPDPGGGEVTREQHILVGDAIEQLRTLDAGSVQTCITSPPYFGLRDYGHEGQIGLEPTPDEYVAKLVAVFAEVKRVLRDEGTLWLNLGDSWSSGGRDWYDGSDRVNGSGRGHRSRPGMAPGIKPKDLYGIPWMVAFALRADGWYLRSEIIWAKPNPMPESVQDRPTRAHEQVFLLSKSPRYYYDAKAIREPATVGDHPRTEFANTPEVPPGAPPHKGLRRQHAANKQDETHSSTVQGGDRWSGFNGSGRGHEGSRNKRSVWTIPTQPYPEAHFATYPEKLIEPMVLAGAPEGGTVLDPFAGSGTTGVVAHRLGREFIGIELNPEYAEMAERRIAPHRDQGTLEVEVA